jgi:hypothetical protein
MDGEGDAIAEYDSYELGLRMLSDEHCDAAKQIEEGRFRMITKPEQWAALMRLLPILRKACQMAIDEAEQVFDLDLPKHW